MNSIINDLRRFNRRLVFAAFFLLLTVAGVSAQNLDRIERSRAKDMLKAIKSEIKDKYYDPAFKGVNLDERFKIAEDKLDQATSLGQAFGIIAQAVLDLNDSHTIFYPPSRSTKFDYGFRMQMIGDKCFVTEVKPNSDAEKKGLQPGDQILSVEKFKPIRKDMWKMLYYYNTLSPRPGLNLIVQSPAAKEPRELNIASKVKTEKTILNFEDIIRDIEMTSDDVIEHRFVQVGNTAIWKMPTFSTDPHIINEIMQGKLKNSGNLILDLRGNGGGYVVTLEELAGYFVEKDIKIADLKGRKEMKPQMAKSKGKDVYKGNLIVLIDSQSGSASEVFARFVQLQQRGVVIGDYSSGAVMQSRGVPMKMGADSIIPYAISVTNADVIMADGKSLEHVGVTPQLVMLPTGADLAARRDVVLAAALELFGQKVTPEDAGKFFPYKWKEN
ncbi:MAG: S41 family peptidase [Acidobacteriota bacterium]|nr:S41 family peptidase [Acidobacteriota bacterium]